MHIKCIVDVSEIPLSGEEWNKLISENETNTLFQTYEWFISWWDVFGYFFDLFFLVVYEGENPIGFAPLAISTKFGKSKTIQFIGQNKADYLDFVTPINKPEAITLIFDYLLKHIRDWDRIILNNIPRESTTNSLLERACKRHGIHYLKNKSIKCPYLKIEGRHKEIQKLLNKYSNKRPLNYFNRQGKVEFRVLSGDDIRKHLPIFIAQHIKRWSSTSSPSLFNNQYNQSFYEKLTQKLVHTEWLHFSVLELDGIPISYHFGFDYNGKLYWYKPSYNIDYAAHSPGILMIRFLIETALHDNRSEFDFTIGGEPFKKRFTNEMRHNVKFQIFKKNTTFWVHRARLHTGKLKRHIFMTK
jgi:CelD/BcsL family acetyltransferase involved in cellulose biosynthesis